MGVAINPSIVPNSRSRAIASEAAMAGPLSTIPTSAGIMETVNLREGLYHARSRRSMGDRSSVARPASASWRLTCWAAKCSVWALMCWMAWPAVLGSVPSTTTCNAAVRPASRSRAKPRGMIITALTRPCIIRLSTSSRLCGQASRRSASVLPSWARYFRDRGLRSWFSTPMPTSLMSMEKA